MNLCFDTAVMSIPGDREVNQDRVGQAAADGASCWVLADGLGGHGGGEFAAHMAVEAALAAFRKDPAGDLGTLADVLEEANDAVLRGQKENPMQSQMRTTVVALIARDRDGDVCWGHSGDSRLYWFRNGRIVHQTRDHSVSQSLVDAGRIAASQVRFHEDRSRLVHSLGAGGAWFPEISESGTIHAGDAFLLASDGFWEWITEIEMEAELAKATSAQSWLDGMRRRVVSVSEPGAERDNASAIAIFVEK